MNYVQETSALKCTDQTTADFPLVTAEGTGLGYYSEESGGTYLWPENGGEVTMEPDGYTRYILLHIESGSAFGSFVYSEAHIRAWLELVAPLTDWTLPVAEMIKRSDFPTVQTIRALLKQAVGEVVA